MGYRYCLAYHRQNAPLLYKKAFMILQAIFFFIQYTFIRGVEKLIGPVEIDYSHLPKREPKRQPEDDYNEPFSYEWEN